MLSRGLELLNSGTSTPSGLHTDCDYYLVIKTLEVQIQQWHHNYTPQWTAEGSDGTGRKSFGLDAFIVRGTHSGAYRCGQVSARVLDDHLGVLRQLCAAGDQLVWAAERAGAERD